MAIKVIVSAILCCLTAQLVRAGDAIAVGFDWEGVWTAVTYNRSSTPRGGAHYHEAADACLFAQRDLRARADHPSARTEIIGQSDRTGFVAIAHGRRPNENKGVMTIGRGPTQDQADEQALERLRQKAATEETNIVYRYFSYGSDSVKPKQSKGSSKQTT